jgi:ferredoxin
MKVNIDSERCSGTGVCEETCPEIFRVDDNSGIAVIQRKEFDKKDEECISEAAENCPNQAIIVEE